MLEKVKELSKNRNFEFYVDEDGEITQERYNVEGRNAEIFIQQRPSNPSLTSVMVEGMSDTHPHLIKTLEFLMQVDEKFKLANLRLDNNPKISVEDFVKQKSIKNGMPEFLYHGTSSDAASSILESGLLPRDISNQNSKYKSIQSGESLSDRVYLCTFGNIGSAKFAARQAASVDHSKPVILKIETQTLLRENLRPDEDSKAPTWEDSMNSMGSLSYIGIIKPNLIEIELDMTQDLNNGMSIEDTLKSKTKSETFNSSTVVYHGNENKVHKFSEIMPSFFTTDIDYAKGYGDNVKEYTLDIKKVFDTSNDEFARNYYNEKFLNDPLGQDAEKIEKGQHISFVHADNFWAFLSVEEQLGKGNGYDSIVVDERIEKGYKTSLSIVPLDNSQIKPISKISTKNKRGF